MDLMDFKYEDINNESQCRGAGKMKKETTYLEHNEEINEISFVWKAVGALLLALLMSIITFAFFIEFDSLGIRLFSIPWSTAVDEPIQEIVYLVAMIGIIFAGFFFIVFGGDLLGLILYRFIWIISSGLLATLIVSLVSLFLSS